MIDIVAVRHEGRISMLKLIDGTIVTRVWIVKQIEGGQHVMTRPIPPATGARVHVVRQGNTEFLSTNPNESSGDNLGALPTF